MLDEGIVSRRLESWGDFTYHRMQDAKTSFYNVNNQPNFHTKLDFPFLQLEGKTVDLFE